MVLAMEITMTGTELKKVRRDVLRIRQDQFGKIVGAHSTTISDWERNGDKPIPHCAAVLVRLIAGDWMLQRRVEDMVGGI